MDRSNLNKRIQALEEEIPKLTNTLFAMKITNTETYPANYEELSTDAALLAERIACSLRSLIYAANLIPKPVLMEKTAQVHGIEIDCRDGCISITLPGLLPKKKKMLGSTFLTDPLHAALEAYTKEHLMGYYKECVICFTHMFDQTLPAKRVRDYDNMESKQILDIICLFFLEDDTGILCDAYRTTCFGEKDCTIVTIMEPFRFPKWLGEQKKDLYSMSDFT